MKSIIPNNIPAAIIEILFIIQLWSVSQAQQPDTLDPWSVSDQELFNYLRAEERLYDMKVRSKMEVEQYSEKLGMPLQRYYQIAKMVNDTTLSHFRLSDRELAIVKKISVKIQEINRRLPKQSKRIMDQEDLTPQRYQQLEKEIKRSYVLRERIAKLMEFFSL